MKTVLLILLFPLICNGQEILIDSCGLDSSGYLNKNEAEYFNKVLEVQRLRSNFDFKGKKIGFAEGNFGKSIITKKEYFEMWGKDYFLNNISVANFLLILEEDEKLKSGGFDAVIVSWSKIGVFGKHRERLVENMNTKSN